MNVIKTTIYTLLLITLVTSKLRVSNGIKLNKRNTNSCNRKLEEKTNELQKIQNKLKKLQSEFNKLKFEMNKEVENIKQIQINENNSKDITNSSKKLKEDFIIKKNKIYNLLKLKKKFKYVKEKMKSNELNFDILNKDSYFSVLNYINKIIYEVNDSREKLYNLNNILIYDIPKIKNIDQNKYKNFEENNKNLYKIQKILLNIRFIANIKEYQDYNKQWLKSINHLKIYKLGIKLKFWIDNLNKDKLYDIDYKLKKYQKLFEEKINLEEKIKISENKNEKILLDNEIDKLVTSINNFKNINEEFKEYIEHKYIIIKLEIFSNNLNEENMWLKLDRIELIKKTKILKNNFNELKVIDENFEKIEEKALEMVKILMKKENEFQNIYKKHNNDLKEYFNLKDQFYELSRKQKKYFKLNIDNKYIINIITNTFFSNNKWLELIPEKFTRYINEISELVKDEHNSIMNEILKTDQFFSEIIQDNKRTSEYNNKLIWSNYIMIDYFNKYYTNYDKFNNLFKSNRDIFTKYFKTLNNENVNDEEMNINISNIKEKIGKNKKEIENKLHDKNVVIGLLWFLLLIFIVLSCYLFYLKEINKVKISV